MPAQLPRALRGAAQHRFLLSCFANPLGATLTIGTVVQLLALHYGASDLAMGLLYGSQYLTGLLAVLAPLLLAGRDTTAVTAGAWWLRSFIGAGLLLLPLLAHDAVKAWALVAIVTAFFAVRAVAMATMPSVVRALCAPRDLPRLNASAQLRWHLGSLVTSLLALLVLRHSGAFPSVETAYWLLLALGLVFNLVTSWLLSTLPPTGTIERLSPRALLGSLHEVLAERGMREVVMLTLLQVPLAVAAAYQINALKRWLLLDDGAVAAVTLGGLLAAILGTRALVRISGRIPARILLIGSHAGLLACASGWLGLGLLPWTWRAGTGMGLAVISTLFLAISGATLGALTNQRLPPGAAVGVSAIYQVVGVVAALLGIGAVAATEPLARWLGLPEGSYGHAFALWGLLSLVICVVAGRITARGLGDFFEDLAQLRPANLGTLFRAHDLPVRGESGPGGQRAIEGLLVEATPASRELLLEYLRSPRTRHRHAALRALVEQPLDEAVPLVAAEARDRDSPLRLEAATALGFIQTATARACLHQLVEDPDRAVAASAWKGLLRHGVEPDRPRLLAFYRSLDGARQRMEIQFGFAARRDRDGLAACLAWELERGTGPAWLRSTLLRLAECLGCEEAVAELLQTWDADPATARAELIRELPDPCAGLERRTLLAALEQGDTACAALRPANPWGLAPRDAVTLIGLVMIEHGRTQPARA